MPLKVSDGMGAWIDDFKKSDAPQFKGKSAEERRDMAIAAYMSAKKGPKDEADGHFMYKDGKKVMVNTKADHDKYAAKGYTMNERITSVDVDQKKRDLKVAKIDKQIKNIKDEDVNEISSNKLGDYMTKSARSAAKPGQSARTQDKRISGQSMADKKIRKKMGYSSDAKVPAGMNEAVRSADKKPEKYVGPDGKTKVRMVPADKEVVKQEDKAADRASLQKAMDVFKRRGGKVTKVAPGKAAGYHGKDDPGSDMHGMMDKGDTKSMPKKKFVRSMK